MRLIETASSGSARLQDLGSLWREAEKLGRIEVDQQIGERGIYRVQIRFERGRSGSTIWATGKSPHIEQALAAAMDEARELGAGGRDV